MATSRSPEKWIAGAWLYSGRRDPSWELSVKQSKAILKYWETMPRSSQRPATISGLGYRGAFLRASGGREWLAFNGVASLKTSGGIDVRIDNARKFEGTLLASAPEGLLPAHLLSGR